MILHHQLQVPSLSPSTSSWMWNYEEERKRQQKWQEEQERLLQVKAFSLSMQNSAQVKFPHHPFIFVLVLRPWVCLFVLGQIPTGSEEAGGRVAESATRCDGGGTPRRRGSAWVTGDGYGSGRIAEKESPNHSKLQLSQIISAAFYKYHQTDSFLFCYFLNGLCHFAYFFRLSTPLG